MTNIYVARAFCALLDELAPASDHRSHADLIEFVEDRPGHDLRYAIDWSKAERELGWRPEASFETGLRKTVTWYLENKSWCDAVREQGGSGGRLGLGADSKPG
jgi:dTDP-glucose 4,6-dehydratase